MITRALLFPTSSYLTSQWWHRLAIVVLWAWLATIAVWIYNNLIYDPFASCIQVTIALEGTRALDCRSNAFDYAWANVLAEPLATGLMTGGLLAIAIYVAAILPSLVYRVLLYIVKGGGWRDPANAA